MGFFEPRLGYNFFSGVGSRRMDKDLHHCHGVVVKDGGDIFRRELVRCV